MFGEIAWEAEQLAASQEELKSMKLFILFAIYYLFINMLVLIVHIMSIKWLFTRKI